MPSGLDHTAVGSGQHAQAHRLYKELERWCVGMDEIVVLGDLNESLMIVSLKARVPRRHPLRLSHTYAMTASQTSIAT
jgi:hypothetical protein